MMLGTSCACGSFGSESLRHCHGRAIHPPFCDSHLTWVNLLLFSTALLKSVLKSIRIAVMKCACAATSLEHVWLAPESWNLLVPILIFHKLQCYNTTPFASVGKHWKNKIESLKEDLWTPTVLKFCVSDLLVRFLLLYGPNPSKTLKTLQVLFGKNLKATSENLEHILWSPKYWSLSNQWKKLFWKSRKPKAYGTRSTSRW